jgi:putative Mg2+ transporter-C (MgtC) family protein
MDALWSKLAEDFGDVSDAGEWVRMTVRMLVAAALGAALGWERMRAGKDAGLRTHMLLALGSAFFVLAPQRAGMGPNEISRVYQGLLSGIGFLGGGAILKDTGAGRVRGLTTAAALWTTAAVGAAVGLGRELAALLMTVLALIILNLLVRLEKRFPPRPETGRPHEEDGPHV